MRSIPKTLMPGTTARQLGRILALYGGLGVVVGLVAACFVPLVEATSELLVLGVAGGNAVESATSWPTGNRWWMLVIPTLGGLASGLVCVHLAPEAMGTGTGAVIDAYHRHAGSVRRRAPLAKIVASVMTIGTGGSAGVEGPIGFIGAGFGSLISHIVKLSPSERRILLMAGFAAGVGAVFHAPMAASLFATEVLYRDLDMEHEVLVPAIVASTVAYAVFGAVHGWSPIWTVPSVGFASYWELGPYLVLAAACAAGGGLFIWIHGVVERYLGRSPAFPLWARPAIGGLGVGVVALFVPGAAGAGYDLAQRAIDGNGSMLLLLALVLAKMLTSALTSGSGGSGGLFAPSLVIGSLFGSIVAAATTWLFPGLDLNPAAFAIVGMAGYFAAVLNTPVSTVIMVSEVVGSYRLLVPTLWVCVLAWFLLRRRTLYLEQVPSRLDAPGHVSDMMEAVLRRVTIKDMIGDTPQGVATVPPGMPLRELVQLFSRTAQGVFPIVGGSGKLLGVVDGQKLRRTIGETGLDAMFIASDFQATAVTVTRDDNLSTAVRTMTMSHYDELIVTDPRQPSAPLALLSRRQVISAYHQRMLDRDVDQESISASESDQELRLETPLVSLNAAFERGGLVRGVTGSCAAEVIEQIVERIEVSEGHEREELRALLLEREQLGSTNIGGHVALAHPRSDGLRGTRRPRVFFVPLPTPIIWHPDDEVHNMPEVRTVVLLLAPRGHQHLALLGALARSLRDPVIRRLIRDRAPALRLRDRLGQLASNEG